MLLSTSQLDFISQLRESNAVTAENPLTVDPNGPVTPDELEALIKIGLIRRAAPYRYYLLADSRPARLMAAMDAKQKDKGADPTTRIPWNPRRLMKTIVFWIIVILIPIILLQLLGGKR